MFFRLLRLGLGTESADGLKSVGMEGLVDIVQTKNGDAETDWMKICALGVEQGVAAVMMDGLQILMESGRMSQEYLPPRTVRMKWLAHTMQVERKCRSQYALSKELAYVYSENGIRTVVLKGIAAGLNYPNPDRRPCGDLDCFLMGDYAKGNDVAEAVGAKVDKGFYKHSHIVYKGLTVENHQFCTAVRGSKRVKDFERLLQSLLREEGTRMISDSCLECPSPMFNALFLTHHAQRHFLTEGIALRHICDWAMLLHRRGNEIDWQAFAKVCDEQGMRQFADSMTRLSHNLLGVAVPDGYVAEVDAERDTYLLNAILYNQKNHVSGSVWKQRMYIMGSVFKNQNHYRLFSDTSFLKDSLKLVRGFCFDRNPKI